MLATRYRLPDRREHASVRGDMVVVTVVISMGSDRSLGPLAAAWVARLEVLFDNFEKSATRSPAGAFSTGVNQITERVKRGRASRKHMIAGRGSLTGIRNFRQFLSSILW